MTYDREKVGREIRKRRLALGLTQETVAEQCGRVLRFYSKIELGTAGMSVDTLLSICKVLQTTPDALLLPSPSEKTEENQKWISEALSSCPPEAQQTAIELLKVYLKSIGK